MFLNKDFYKKGLSILIVLIAFSLLVSTVSASEDISADSNLTTSYEDIIIDSGMTATGEDTSIESNKQTDNEDNREYLKNSQTDTIAENNENALSEEIDSIIYVDASAETDGNGSLESPYKYLNHSFSGKTVHLADGKYFLDNTLNIALDTTIIGESMENTIIDGDLYYRIHVARNYLLVLKNVTVNNAGFTCYGSLNATNVKLRDGLPTGDGTGDAWGSLINNRANYYYTSGVASFINFDGCVFEDSATEYGGAIYLTNASTTIKNSKFINITSYSYGGAIAIEEGGNLTVINTTFTNCSSMNDAGGAIYSRNTDLYVYNSSFENCSATFGGAIAQLESTITVENSNFTNNTAQYEGGAIFDIYAKMETKYSRFDKNSAINGAAIFVDFGATVRIIGNNFTKNNASGIGGAVFSNQNNVYTEYNNNFTGNIAANYSDIYRQGHFPMYYGNSNYTVIVNNNTDIDYDGELPSSYFLGSEGQMTSIKNQESGGSCWAFAAMASLESAILKACNQSYDFSEENMKNLMAYYSEYGWRNFGGFQVLPNMGGIHEIALGYLTSWMGPVNESQDEYDSYSALSYLSGGNIHVQNIYFVPPRENYTDNDNIKRALMKYGALAVDLYMYQDSPYLTGNSYYFDLEDYPSNHAVTIVGWNDHYSRNNFGITPPGDGAFLVKNSWGPNWGYDGLFYVSYYDTVFCKLGIWDAYTFIFNDTTPYNKNYQYDPSGMTDYFIPGCDTIWAKNIFTSTGDDLLAAFSTYFNQTTDYTAYIYVNDVLKLSQSGTSPIGYYTIKLSQYIPLKKDDKFSIVLKLNGTDGANFAVNERETVRNTYETGVSFFSLDGKTWTDLVNYRVNFTESEHWYNGQVACIKAFTVQSGKYDTIMEIKDIVKTTLSDIIVKAVIRDNYGMLVSDGNVTFEYGGQSRTINVKDGAAEFTISYSEAGNYSISATYNGGSYYKNSSSKTAVITVNPINAIAVISIDGNKQIKSNQTISIDVYDENGDLVKNGSVVLAIGEDIETLNLSNGHADFTYSFADVGDHNIEASYIGTGTYNSTSSSLDIYINKLNSVFKVYVDADNSQFKGMLKDDVGDSISGIASVIIYEDLNNDGKFTSDESVFSRENLELEDGQYILEYEFKENRSYQILSRFNGDDNYYSSMSNYKFKYTIAEIIASDLNAVYKDGSKFNISVLNDSKPVQNVAVSFTINGLEHNASTDSNGIASLSLNGLSPGTYEIISLIKGSNISSNNTITVNKWDVEKLSISAPDLSKYYSNGDKFKVTVKYGGKLLVNEKVTIKVGTSTFTQYTDKNGQVQLAFNNVPKKYSFITSVNDGGASKSVKSTVTIKKMPVHFTSISKSVKRGKKISVKVLDRNNKVVKNVKVKIKVSKKTYYVKTNSKGIAKLKIAIKAKKVKAAFSLKSNSYYTAQKTVKKSIKIK